MRVQGREGRGGGLSRKHREKSSGWMCAEIKATSVRFETTTLTHARSAAMSPMAMRHQSVLLASRDRRGHGFQSLALEFANVDTVCS